MKVMGAWHRDENRGGNGNWKGVGNGNGQWEKN